MKTETRRKREGGREGRWVDKSINQEWPSNEESTTCIDPSPRHVPPPAAASSRKPHGVQQERPGCSPSDTSLFRSYNNKKLKQWNIMDLCLPSVLQQRVVYLIKTYSVNQLLNCPNKIVSGPLIKNLCRNRHFDKQATNHMDSSFNQYSRSIVTKH